ncbi:MAG: PQQ-dependent sugar dehydrogenase [Pseudomonadota bacterium]
MRTTSVRLAALLSIAPLLWACGGGGGGGTVTPPTVVNPTLSIANASVTESTNGDATMTFTVSVGGALPAGASYADASVDYATVADTASAGSDFVMTSGTLQLPSGVTSATIDVQIIGDSDIEPDEQFLLELSSPVNASIATSNAVGVIRDDDTPIASFGLDRRPDNQTCIAPARPIVGSTVQFEDPYPNLPSFIQPTKLLLEPVPGGRWFVLQKTGQILTFDPTSAASSSEFFDLNDTRNLRTSSEGGLLGMAFHPDYPMTPEVFLSYTINHTGPAMRSVVSRLTLDDLQSPGAGTTEEVLIEIDQDFDNHNGGDIAFGPDGLLYIGLGDGGSGNDPRQRSQDNSRLLGAMLRIDVEGTGAGYNIPSDNPFATNPVCGPSDNSAACPEIYAWGLRNPWRWAFDSQSDALWLADVGQGAREEINLIERGGNYGWRCKEGTRDTVNSGDCEPDTLIDPVTEYDRSFGSSVTGGQVYRGSDLPDLVGLYVYGDFGSGRIWAARPDVSGNFINDELARTNFSPTAFANGPDGELYMVDINGSNGQGRVRRMIAASAGSVDTIAERLSDSGCVEPANTTQPYSGLLPYGLNAPFWSDGAVKDRFIGLPNGETITIDSDGDFEFPIGTVIVKNFRLGNRLVETRHIMRHTDGVWAGYTYEWNEAQTEATRVRGGKTALIAGQTWIYPSEAQCMQCHTAAAKFALGPEVNQLNRNFDYPRTGRRANQLETIEHVMMLTAPLAASVDQLPAMVDPEDTSASVNERARAYLDTNCSSCHRPNGPTPSDLDLRYETSLADTNACDAEPSSGDLGITNARIIAPGDSGASVLVERMNLRDVNAMPPIGSGLVDTAGVALLSAWIDQLPNCN